MLSDEEKKAMQYFYNLRATIDESNMLFDEDIDVKCGKETIKQITIILNLIKKQFKEIEELKTINQMQKYRIEVIDERELISKDKLKEILGIEENIDNDKLLSLLQTIVDENVRLEDIEDRKIQIEYNNVFNKGVKSIEDKIKAKIEELGKEEKEELKGTKGQDRYDRYAIKQEYMHKRSVLQSLLEKE